MSIKEVHALSVPWFHFGIELHRGRRSGHRNKAWTASSCCVLHASQQPSVMILRWTKFNLVGRAFLHAFHARCLILLRTWSPQILFHNGFNTSMSDGPDCLLHCSSYKNLYPDLTVYTPSELKGHSKTSSWMDLQSGIFFMVVASKAKKVLSIASSFHTL